MQVFAVERPVNETFVQLQDRRNALDAPRGAEGVANERLGGLNERHLGRWQIQRSAPAFDFLRVGERRGEVSVDRVDFVWADTGRGDCASDAPAHSLRV